MADTGFVLAGTGENIAVGSNEDWVNPSNVTIENDTTYAESDISSTTDFSDYLRATNFSFSVPAGATIDGIEVEIRREGESTSGTVIYDEYVYLVHAGSVISGCDNKGKTTLEWQDFPHTSTYGGAADIWGCSLTPAIVNSSTFGLQLMAENQRFLSRWARVYWIKVKVYYTEAAGTTYQATVVSAGVGNATADARKPQKVVGNVAGSGDANADIRVAKQAESGSGGTSSASADSKAAKRAEGEASGIGNASAGAKLARRVESGASGAGGASSEARGSHGLDGLAEGNASSDANIKKSSRTEGSASGLGVANASALHVVNQVTYQATVVSAGSGDANAETKIARRAESNADGSGNAGVDARTTQRAEGGSDGAASANANAKAVKLVVARSDGGSGANADVYHFLKPQYVEGLSEGGSTADAVAKKVLRIEAAAAGIGVTKSAARKNTPSVTTPVRSTANDMIPPLSQQVVDPNTGFPTKPLADFLFFLSKSGYDDTAIQVQLQSILSSIGTQQESVSALLNSIKEEVNARTEAIQTLEQQVEEGNLALTRKIDFYKSSLNQLNATIQQIQQVQVTDKEAFAKAVQTLSVVTDGNNTSIEEIKTVAANVSSKQAVNYVAYSEDFSQPEWNAYYDGITILSNTETGPNGESDATKLRTNASTQSNTGVFNVPGLTLDLNEVYTASIWLKSDTGGETVNIGFGTGSVGTSVTLSSSWKRYIVTATPDNALFLDRIFVLTAAPSTTFYAFGAQLNRGNAADDYITTHGEPGLDLGGISSYAKYAIEINANGRISGFKVIGTETRTDCIVEADNFAVQDPDAGSGDFTFQVENGKVKVNGEFIVNESLDTPQITDNAVTVPLSATGTTSATTTSYTFDETTTVLIICYGKWDAGESGQKTMKLKIDSTTEKTWEIYTINTIGCTITPAYMTNVSSGAHTFTVELKDNYRDECAITVLGAKK